MINLAVLGANSLYPRLTSCGRHHLPNPDGLRHAQIGKGIDDGGADVRFGHLPLEGSGVQAVAQLLQPVHHVLGDAAPVLVAIVLPASAALGGDVVENTVAWMIVAPGNGAVPRGNGRTGVAVGNGGMASVGVAGAIGGHLRDFAFDLVKQSGEHFAVAPIGRRHFNADDVLACLVDGQVDLAPGAALADSVLAHFPLSANQIVRLPRLTSGRSYSDQFVTRYRCFDVASPVTGLTLAD